MKQETSALRALLEKELLKQSAEVQARWNKPLPQEEAAKQKQELEELFQGPEIEMLAFAEAERRLAERGESTQPRLSLRELLEDAINEQKIPPQLPKSLEATTLQAGDKVRLRFLRPVPQGLQVAFALERAEVPGEDGGDAATYLTLALVKEDESGEWKAMQLFPSRKDELSWEKPLSLALPKKPGRYVYVCVGSGRELLPLPPEKSLTEDALRSLVASPERRWLRLFPFTLAG